MCNWWKKRAFRNLIAVKVYAQKEAVIVKRLASLKRNLQWDAVTIAKMHLRQDKSPIC